MTMLFGIQATGDIIVRKYAHSGDFIVQLHKLAEGRGIDCKMEASV
jgi:hypothetical protein